MLGSTSRVGTDQCNRNPGEAACRTSATVLAIQQLGIDLEFEC